MRNKTSLLLLIGSFTLGFFACLGIINYPYGEVHAADQTISTGAVLDSSTTQSFVIIESGHKGSLVNKGSATVYINWDGGTVDATNTAGNKKGYIDSGDAIRVPANVKKFSHATATGTAKLIFVED